MKCAGIIKNDVVNGYDVCVSYWCQGCSLRCPGCHNPQTWDFNGGIDVDENELINYILSAIAENGIQRNLSILGGEPLCSENIPFIAKLIETVRAAFPSIKVFLWSGYQWEELLEYASNHSKYEADLKTILQNTAILVDGKFSIEHRDITLPFRGSSNQRVIDVQRSLKSFHAVTVEENGVLYGQL